MGQTPTQLESGGHEGLEVRGSEQSAPPQDAENVDISEYLLLHHNYAAKPPSVSKANTTSTKRKYKAIKPKRDILETAAASVGIISPAVVDQNANVITLLVDDSSVTTIAPESLTVETEYNRLCVPTTQAIGSTSPMSSISDRGYESLDSPVSISEEDIWDASVSELFPSLM